MPLWGDWQIQRGAKSWNSGTSTSRRTGTGTALTPGCPGYGPGTTTHVRSALIDGTRPNSQLSYCSGLLCSSSKQYFEQSDKDATTIICGDFNDDTRELLHSALPGFSDAWDSLPPDGGQHWTFDPTTNPLAALVADPPSVTRRFDRVMVGGRNAYTVGDVQLIASSPVDGVWLSDHCRVWCQITRRKDSS
ncbi:hypothetical protein M427DRAFT_393771 [Gonapodya prolifera JEL478]|uniref:Endonuclease/exonuclease/phosphatase domain-containing protein n=1 Tax=Gonapodya prolifera (strain JEL478) TaxID=1344416 RepID=A0A139A764_GONPJ|nr:hypothetical protein M427DRAFT_393771 [Gonapodya prolifera JEL478]|eukprot:KXS12640.1 hypothetical protein M427DRAFT_393771 [Gonapodya prolifera JEL478]